MFNQQANSKEERKTVNTRGLQFYNTEGFCPSTLVCDYWDNGMFSIKVHPAKEKAKQTEREKFDYEQAVQTALNMNKASDLLAFFPDLIKAHEEGKEISRYVDIAGVNLLGVGTRNIDGHTVFYFAIHKQLNNDRIPQASMYYQFNEADVIADYNPETGEFSKATGSLGEFEVFTKYLQNGINSMTKAYTHSNRVVDQFFRKRLEDKIDSLMLATGAQNNYANNGNSGYRRGGNTNLFSDNSGASKNNSKAPEEQADPSNLDEELPF